MHFFKLLFLSILLVNSKSVLSNNLEHTFWQYRASIKLNDYRLDLTKISQLDIDIAGVDKNSKIVDVLINAEQYKILESKGYNITLHEVKGVSLGPDQEYKNPDEIEQLLLNYHQQYPLITKLISIGKSLEGRDIWALKISDNADLDEYYEEPAILFNSMHHAREVMTPEVGLDIIEYLLTNYASNQSVTKWVNSNEIWVIPMFNVDGNNKMWSQDSWWRKNTRGGFGVDLNRNYPSGWNSCNGSSGNTSSQTYRGDAPGSEPETQAMMNFVENIRPVFDISYHAFSEIVIYPLGCDGLRTQTKDIVETIGKQIGGLINYEAGTSWELLYSVDGGDIDWMYQEFQVIPYVIEVNSRWQGFHPDFKRWRNKTVERNRAGWQHLLNRLEKSSIRGQFLFNQSPVSDFTIIVNKLDQNTSKTFYQNYRGHKSGMFHLILNPGQYELLFKYNSVEVKKIVTINDLAQHLDINL